MIFVEEVEQLPGHIDALGRAHHYLSPLVHTVVEAYEQGGLAEVVVELGGEVVFKLLVKLVAVYAYRHAGDAAVLDIDEELYVDDIELELARTTVALHALGCDAHEILLLEHAVPLGPFGIKDTQLASAAVVFYLDGDADGVFTMTPAATAAYVAHLDMEGAKSITFTPCDEAGEACTAVKFTCTEETEVPANIQFGTSVETQLEGTWKYSNKYKKFVNVERLTVLEGATLNMSDTVGGTTEKSFFINNLGTANVSGVTYLETLNMANYGEMNIKTNAELRVKTTLRNRSKSLTDHGKIYNYGVLATVLGTDGEINNWGYIKQMTAASKTYITNNQTPGATFASIYVTWNNELGIIELFDKDDDNYSVSNEENQGFIMITTTAASVKAADFGKEANYVKVAGDCTALDFTPEADGRVKFIEIASNEEVVWSANGTDKLTGLIMKEGTKMNLKKSNTLNVATAFLKGIIYQGGALTIDSFTGYLGGAPTDKDNVLKY